MRDDKDFLSYKTYVYNFFNSSNFFNFTQVEPAKLELFQFPTNSCSSSSSDFPLVSGQRLHRKMNAQRQIVL